MEATLRLHTTAELGLLHCWQSSKLVTVSDNNNLLLQASNGGSKAGTITVSSAGLGQVALQIQQQVRVS